MKNSKSKIALLTITAIFFLSNAINKTNAQTHIVNMIRHQGKLMPMVELSEVKISVLGIKPQNVADKTATLAFENSAKIVIMEKHFGEFMPAVLLDEAIVIGAKPKATTTSGLNKALGLALRFIIQFVSHYGII